MSGIDPLIYFDQNAFSHILGYLDRKEKALAGQVCKGWHQFINAMPQLLWRQEAAKRFQFNKFVFPEIEQKVYEVSIEKPHEQSKKSLSEIVASVHFAASHAQLLPEKTFDEIAVGLIGMLKGEAFVQSETPFAGIEPETRNLAVAGPSYINREIRNSKSSVRNAAVDAFKKLADFFLLHADSFPTTKASAHNMIKGLSLSYLKGCQSSEEVKSLVSIFRHNLPLVQQVSVCLEPSQVKGALFDEMALLVKAPEHAGWKPLVVGNRHRIYQKWQISDSMKKLLLLSRDNANFSENEIEVIRLSRNALLGLSQLPSQHFCDYRTPGRGNQDPDRYFGNLEDYLQNPDYNFVLNNNQNATSTLRKAAVLFLIRGFESDWEKIRAASRKAVRSLVKDYLASAQSQAMRSLYSRAIFEIVRGGVVNVMGDQKEICRAVLSIFRKDYDLLKDFIEFLPEGEDKEAIALSVKELAPLDEDA